LPYTETKSKATDGTTCTCSYINSTHVCYNSVTVTVAIDRLLK